MKKLLLFVALMCMTAVTFAKENKNPFKATSIEEFDRIVNNLEPKIKSNHLRFREAYRLMVIEKDSSKLSSEDFKSVLTQNVTDAKMQDPTVRSVIVFVKRVPALRSAFAKNILKDPELNKHPVFYQTFAEFGPLRKEITDKNVLRNILVEALCLRAKSTSKNSAKFALTLIKLYEKNISDFKSEDILSDMKRIKKECYAKIGGDTDVEIWKSVIVKVELLTKANQ